jgi:hypothetical protein
MVQTEKESQMRKFTNKQLAEVDRLLDEAFHEGYEAAEFDAKYQSFEIDDPFNLFTLDPDKEELTNNLFTAEANMKRAEAEFNKRDQTIEQRVQEQLGHPLYGRSPAFEAMYQIELMKELEYGTPSVIVFVDYGTPDELYKSEGMTNELFSFWGEQ